MKLVLVATLAAVALTLMAPAASSASPYIRFGVQDDAYLGSDESPEPRLQTLDRLGVKVVRFTIDWRRIARRKPGRAIDPNDPAYDWSRTDAVLNGLHRHGIAVLATLYGTPAWANGGRAANVLPRSKYSLAAFAYAAARRYPWLRSWEIWNEPNLRRFLSPNSPQLYVQRLLNPTYAVLHGLLAGNRVAGGVTSPRPTPSGLSPVAFMRGMRQARARLDAYSHHPYPVTRGETPSHFAAGACRYCKGVLTLANLPQLLREVRRDFGPKRIWLTEYGYQTNPPDRFGVSTAAQAAYVSEAALRAKSARYVDLLIHFMVKDEPQPSGWQSGLLTRLGAVKPSFNAFMLPIAQAARRGLRTTIWGEIRRRGGSQRYKLQRYSGGRWLPVGGYAFTNARGSYTRVVRAGLGARFRVYSPEAQTASLAITVR
jgi:hypothetical protein